MRLIAVKEGGETQETEKWKHLSSEARAIKRYQSVQCHTASHRQPLWPSNLTYTYTHSVASLNIPIIYDTRAFTQLSELTV